MSTQNSSVLTPFIKSLFLDPPNLTPSDLSTVLRCIFRGIPSEVQTAAFLTALRLKGLDQKPEFIAAAATTILEFSKSIPPDLVDPRGYVDIVGTGGDGQDTFNVSTSAAIIAAGMGIPVCKHGGKASTSKSGSGDLLKYLGLDLEKVNDVSAVEIVKKSKFCFLFAPIFHPGMKKAASVRAQLGVPTIFNILGPLINPMPLSARILGVYSEKLGDSYARAASTLAQQSKIHERTMVVYGDIGLDEISPIGTTQCWLIDADGIITRLTLSPEDFGLPENPISSVKSGTPEENAMVLYQILQQDTEEYKIEQGKDSHPLIDYILMNAAALAVVAGLTTSWKEGVELAKTAITSGSALKVLNDFKNAVNEQP